MSVDYEAQLLDIAQLVEPPECAVSPEAIAIGTQSLQEINAKYGPDSDHPLLFHNADHSLGVTRRVIRLTNMLYPFITQPKYREHIYDLGMVGGTTHDWEQLLGSGDNERASVDYAIDRLEASGGPLDTDTFKQRLQRGILATTVWMEDDGELVQAKLQTGVPDPFKFKMAFSDINGIAMEGLPRMMRDATNLYYETAADPTIDELYSFLIKQEHFLSRRLNDNRVKADIAYHFPNTINEVYDVMRQAFHSNIVTAHGMAVLLGKRPELKIPVEAAVKSVGLVDRTLLGDAIGKMIQSKLAS